MKIINPEGITHISLVLTTLDVAVNHQGKGVESKILVELEERETLLNYKFISISAIRIPIQSLVMHQRVNTTLSPF